jgi:hypothetical protein
MIFFLPATSAKWGKKKKNCGGVISKKKLQRGNAKLAYFAGGKNLF